MKGNIDADVPAQLTVASGLLYGVHSVGANVTLATVGGNPLRFMSHHDHQYTSGSFAGKVTGTHDFIKAGAANLNLATTCDFSGFTGGLWVLQGEMRGQGSYIFNPGTPVHVSRRSMVSLHNERLGEISGNGEIQAASGLIFGTAGKHDFNGTDVIFDGATVSPGDMRPGILRLTTGTRNVNIDDATFNIRIDGFDVDDGRKPAYIHCDEFHDEMHDAVYINGDGPVTLGSDITANISVNPSFKIPRAGAEWVILTANGSIIPTNNKHSKGTAGFKQINSDTEGGSIRWTVDYDVSADGRDALILRCKFNNQSIIVIR
ncbi:MAG: hypothetical protein FWG05_03240 [Kiritimatiellaeota bacterium]|nr:hypothetical protein [Kiritimatiellota bacterium]